jgi:hypothetical protein
MPRKTTRLYYGLNKDTGDRLYWTMKVRNATKSVTLNGTVLDAMKGVPGLSIGCHLSEPDQGYCQKSPTTIQPSVHTFTLQDK